MDLEMGLQSTPINQTSNITEEYEYYYEYYYEYDTEFDPRIHHLMKLVYQIIFPVLLALGILCNLINILVLTNLKKQKKNQSQTNITTYYYLITLAATQLLASCAFCVSLSHIMSANLTYQWVYYYAHLANQITNALTSASVYIVVGLSIDRFIALWFHDYYMRVSAPKMAKFRITVALIVPILLYIPNAMYLNVVVETNNGTGWSYEENKEFKWYHFLFLQELCHRIIPAAILIVLNTCIIIGFRKISKKRKNIMKAKTSTRENQERFLLFLLISIVGAFLVTTLPAAVLTFIESKWTGTFEFEVFRAVANFLEFLGFSVNFVLYFCLMPDVREMIKKKLGLLVPRGHHPAPSSTAHSISGNTCGTRVSATDGNTHDTKV